ncbi:MAG: glycosyltransferase family 4 protein, partial [Clostridium sp.]
MKKIKVLIITEVFFPEIGSGANRINNIVILLKKKGYSVDVLTSNPSYPNSEMYEDESFWDEAKKESIYKDSNIFRVKSSKVKKSENFFNRLYIYIVFLFNCILKLFKIQGKYNIVISTTPSIFNGVVGILAKYRLRAKYILDIRDLWPECLKNVGVFRKSKIALKLAYMLEKIILKFPDALIINSNGFRPYLEKSGFKRPIIFVPNSLTENELLDYRKMEENADKHKDFVVVYTGMIGLPQNIRTIVKVANQLRMYKDIKFKIIGTGIQKGKVLELIKHYGISNVTLYDPMPKIDVIKEVSKCSVAIAHLRS